MFERGKGDLESHYSARGLNTKMPKEFRLADGVLDLGLVKLVNLGMDPDKLQVKLEPLNNMGTNFSNIKGALYDYRLSTEYVSNFDMDCTLELHNK